MDFDEIRPVVLGAELQLPDGAVIGQVQDLQLDPAGGGFVVQVDRSPFRVVTVTIDEPDAVELGQVPVADLVPLLGVKVAERWTADSLSLPGFDPGDWHPNPPPPPPPPSPAPQQLPALAGLDDGDWQVNPPPPDAPAPTA